MYKIVLDYGPANLNVLENLTGLEIRNQKELYEYFSKTLIFTEDFIGKLAFAQLAEYFAKEANTLDDVKDALKKTLRS